MKMTATSRAMGFLNMRGLVHDDAHVTLIRIKLVSRAFSILRVERAPLAGLRHGDGLLLPALSARPTRRGPAQTLLICIKAATRRCADCWSRSGPM